MSYQAHFVQARRKRTRSHHKRALSPAVSPDFNLRYRKQKIPRFDVARQKTLAQVLASAMEDGRPEVIASAREFERLCRENEQFEAAHPDTMALVRGGPQLSNYLRAEQIRQTLAAAAAGRAFDYQAFAAQMEARFPGLTIGRHA